MVHARANQPPERRLRAMIGAGVFAAVGPATAAGGSGLLIGLTIAAVVAYCNAMSLAALAAVYPQSGGTYVYGRERLGPFWGYIAGWGFVVGKTASCAAMALTFGAYALPEWRRPLGLGAVVVLTAVNCQVIRNAIANASAWTLAPEQRRWTRPSAAGGLFGCAVLAFTLPTTSIVTGTAVLGVGTVIWLVRTLRGRGTGLR